MENSLTAPVNPFDSNAGLGFVEKDPLSSVWNKNSMRGTTLDTLHNTNTISSDFELSSPDHQNLGTLASDSVQDQLLGIEADAVTLAGDLTETTTVMITAEARGSQTPPTAVLPDTLTNGDFLISADIAPTVGDGLDEITTWAFDFTQDPNLAPFLNAESLSSAILTLELTPTTTGIDTDTPGIAGEGLPYVISPEVTTLPLFQASTVNINLLDTYSSDQILGALKTGELGKIPMYYGDDALVSFAKIELMGNVPPIYDSGVFTAGETGQVTTDFLFDGSPYQGELAMFSLEGMEELTPGSPDFIREAAQRALSNSELGHIVIKDPTEGAKFSGVLGQEEQDWNAGEYLGVKSFAMTPGDRFGFMLVPDGLVSEVFENPGISGSKKPLFSMATTDPSDSLDGKQLVDVSGDRSAFAWEDQTGAESDRDYNDVVFQISGAAGGATVIDELIDPTKDWRNSQVGQELVQSVVDPLDLAGNTIDAARPVNVASTGKSYRGWVGGLDPVDFYSFSLGASNSFSITLDGLSANTDIELLDLNGNVLQSSTNSGKAAEIITGTLSAGAYRLRVTPVGNISTAYNLEFTANPLIPGITTTGSDELNKLSIQQSSRLINLGFDFPGQPTFRTDPRFAGIDGTGWATVIIDNGIDLDHPFFDDDAVDIDGDGNLDFVNDNPQNGLRVADRIVANLDFANNDYGASDNSPINRDRGHGSNVTSIAASSDPRLTGVAPGADIIHLKVFPDNGGDASYGDVEQALQWVVANAAQFNIASVNLSLGSGNYDRVRTSGLSDEYQALTDLGVIVVAAAGNDFFAERSRQGVQDQAADPNTIAVGAVWDGNNGGPWTWENGAIDNTTDTDRIASFSQRHATLTDIFAPGASIEGANADGGVVAMEGTSQAAPHISGLAVLAQQLAVQTLGRRLTPGEFGELLRATGIPINDGDDENDNVVNTRLDFRRVDALNLGNAIVNLQTVSVTINEVIGDFDPGKGNLVENLRFGESDFFPRVTVAGGREETRPTIVGNSNLKEPGWVFSQGVDGRQTTIVPIRIKIFNDDSGLANDNDRIDLNPNSGFPDDNRDDDENSNKDLNLLYNITTGEVSDSLTGEVYGRRGEPIRLKGEGDDDQGEIVFTIDGWNVTNPPPPPVNVVVHRIKGDFDGGPFNDSDFYARLSIAGEVLNIPVVEERSDLRPDWQFNRNTVDPIVPIAIEIFDQDLTESADQRIDINPNSRIKDLLLAYNQTTGEIADSITGQVYGTRGQLINLKGEGDGIEGEVWFSVYGPPSNLISQTLI